MTDEELTSVLVSLGSNIDPHRNLPAAVDLLAEQVRVVAASRIYASEAKGAPGAPPFLNAAVEILTTLPPRELKFGVLREIEAALGRVRTEDPNAPRTIDLDLALFGDLVVEEDETGLVVPEPEIRSTAHVALPLADIAPQRRHPVTGETLQDLAAAFASDSSIRAIGRLELVTP